MAIKIPSKNIYSIKFNPVVDNAINKVYTNEYYTDFNAKQLGETISSVGYVNNSAVPDYSAQIPETIFTDNSSTNKLQSVKQLNGFSIDLATNDFYPGSSTTNISGRFQDWILYKITVNKADVEALNISCSATTNYYGRGFSKYSYLEERDVVYNGVSTQIYAVGGGDIEIEQISSESEILEKYFDDYRSYTMYPYSYAYRIKINAIGYDYSRYNDDHPNNYDNDGRHTFKILYIDNGAELIIYLLILKIASYQASNPPADVGMALKDISINLYNNADFKITQYGNREKSFSINNNQSKLLQTNTRNGSISQGEYLANEVLKAYSGGKQTAVISCLITEYYDTNDNLVISPAGSAQSVYSNPIEISVLGTTTYGYETALRVSLNPRLSTAQVQANRSLYYNSEEYTIAAIDSNGDYIVVPQGRLYRYIGSTVTGYREKRPAPMFIKEGDIVIPYIYTNNGDSPLSYNKDYTPKQFKVVGTKISDRQGVTIELTLLAI